MDKAAMNVNLKRLVVELDPQIHKEIKLQAVREGRSYRELITDCFKCYIAMRLDCGDLSDEYRNTES